MWKKLSSSEPKKRFNPQKKEKSIRRKHFDEWIKP